jgi:hypothetical protein
MVVGVGVRGTPALNQEGVMPSKNPHRRRRGAAALTATIALLIASAFPVLASAERDVHVSQIHAQIHARIHA